MLDLATVVFINHAVNGSLRPYHACLTPPRPLCSPDYQPRLAGRVDCKQYAAVKLRELILAGAAPRDFSIWWVTTRTGQPHAVLVQRDTGLVLDNLSPRPASRWYAEKFTGYVFTRQCDWCGDAARADARRILAARALSNPGGHY